MTGVSVTITTDTAALRQQLTDLQKIEVPFAAARAATDVAFKVRAGEIAEMRTVFRAPTDWTLGGMVVDKADKSGKPARVRFEDFGGKGTPAGRYLQPQIDGGPRRLTPFERRLSVAGLLRPGEFLVPGAGAERDAGGNLNPGQISKILSDLGTIDTARASPGGRDRGARRGETYRLERPPSGAPEGIYLQKGGRKLLAFLIVRQPFYRAIFDFGGVARRIIAREFAAAFRANLARAVASSRYRGTV